MSFAGGQIVDNSKHCSVLVTNRIRRTVKFLCAVGLGVPIVGPQWLINSRTHGPFLPRFYLVLSSYLHTRANSMSFLSYFCTTAGPKKVN